VVRYYHPEEFAELQRQGAALGFIHVEAGPLVRSSYHAAAQEAASKATLTTGARP
jgi:lipoic acid synthetase